MLPQRGPRQEAAWKRRKFACGTPLDKDIRGFALDDEDLRPLWDWIAGLK